MTVLAIMGAFVLGLITAAAFLYWGAKA